MRCWSYINRGCDTHPTYVRDGLHRWNSFVVVFGAYAFHLREAIHNMVLMLFTHVKQALVGVYVFHLCEAGRSMVLMLFTYVTQASGWFQLRAHDTVPSLKLWLSHFDSD